jgi:hypothetical protein
MTSDLHSVLINFGRLPVADFLQWLAANWWLVFVFFLFFGGGIWAGAKYLIQQYQDGCRRAQENELKRDMIAKGFTPDEIERTVRASGPSLVDESSETHSATRPPSAAIPQGRGSDKARLVAALAQQEFDADGIECILHALAECPDEELPAKVAAVQTMAEQEMEAEGIVRVLRAMDRASSPQMMPAQASETAFRK